MSEKLSGEEVSKRALDILQSSDFTKTLESFNAKCIKPTMNIMAKKIVKAKKKLKKLQKRQRKQDNQGVVSFDAYFAESNELIKKLGDVWAAGIKDIYGEEYRVSDGQWSDEQIAKAKESNTKPYEINKIKPVLTMEEFIKFRDKMARPS